MEDITDTLSDINPGDRVFKHEGRFVKVRMKVVQPPPGAPTFGVAFIQLSGSETNAAGRAKKMGAGYRITDAETRTIQSDEPIRFEEILKALREETVEKTIRAADLQDDLAKALKSSTIQ